jgi:hypothetical protein
MHLFGRSVPDYNWLHLDLESLHPLLVLVVQLLPPLLALLATCKLSQAVNM